MNKPNLSYIYRNGTRRIDIDALDIDTITSLAGGPVSDDQLDRAAGSALHSDLIHFARDLENESAALSDSVAGLLHADSRAHRRAPTQRRAASARRGWRIASAIAASFVVAVAFWNAGRMLPHQTVAVNTTAGTADRIFAGLDERGLAQQPEHSDRIFNGGFHSDEIFNSRSGG